nr:DUF58 domain-containing protein [Nocardiopsis kunsanensis]
MLPRRTLTARGVCMLVFGSAFLVAGLVVEQFELVAVGVFLVCVPPLSALTLLGAQARVGHSRLVHPHRLHVGQAARVVVRVGNSSPLWPVPSVALADTVPVLLGEEPRFDVGHLGARSVREVNYLVRPQVRGRYPVGPLRVVIGDPLGCVRVTREADTPVSLLVTPRTLALPPLGVRGGPQGEHTPRRTANGAGEQDPVPREYRYGDEMRRVHWPSTAKHGELMVRRDEQQQREHQALFLDTRACAHRGEQADSSLETAVTAAASVAVRSLEDGHDLNLYGADGHLPVSGLPGVLDGLALTGVSGSTGLHAGISALSAGRGPSPGLITVVLGAVGPDEAGALARVGGGARRVAVLCTGAAWPSEEAVHEAERVLASGGWQVLRLPHPDRLPHLWRSTGEAPLPAAAPRVFPEGPL